MLYPALIILLGAAALCLGLGRAAPTRLIGLGAALAALAAALVALAPTTPAEPVELLQLYATSLSLTPQLGAGEQAIAAALLGGGGVALLALAGAIVPAVRGFGAIFAWALLALAAALLSLGAPPLSLAQPLAWAVLAIAGYAAVRASGAAGASEAPPLGLIAGLLASALLAGGLLANGGAGSAGELPAWPAALCGLIAALALAGSPPLVGARAEAALAPAALGALIYGLAAPAAALSWLLRSVAALPLVPQSWALSLGLLGGLGALACGAGALGERRLRALLSWVVAGQIAGVVAAAGLAGPLAALAGPGLLLALMLSVTVSAGAAALFERTTGSDNYSEGGSGGQPLVGALWALGALGLLGLPPLWGLWPRLWLLQAAAEEQPWLLAPMLAGLGLTLLALLAPLGRLWTTGGTAPARVAWSDLAPAALAGLPLLILGLAPGLAWEDWLSQIAFAPDALPLGAGALMTALMAGLTLAGLGLALARARPARTFSHDPDEQPVALAPEALGTALRPLAWLGDLAPALRALWAGLTRVSQGLRLLMALFEQRYYLLGVLGALIVIMLLMAQ
jgi:formate hydrogenlyase subunit 3/multisubunit Na+/H+ antiporter MnhD subunit